MLKKLQSEVIHDLQNNPDFIILNNPLSAPKFIRKLGKGKEKSLTEIYTPKLFYDIISRITSAHLQSFEEGRDVVTLTLNIGEFLKSNNTGNSKSLYRHVIDCIDLLQTTQVKWKDDEKESGTAIITHYEYYPKQGKIEVVLYKEFVKQVVSVTNNEHFSFLKQYLYQLQNAQAIKLFPFFISWRNKGIVEMSVDFFKKKFDYDTKGYKAFINLRVYVLDPAIEEINKKTNLNISYKLLGDNLTGKRQRVSGLQFFIKEKVKQQQLPQQTAEEYTPVEVVETMRQVQKSMVEKAENLYLIDILRVFQVFEPDSSPENINGFLSAFDNPKAVLEACLYAEQEQLKGHAIKNFRGYLIAGIPKSLGFGILEQRAKEQAKTQQAAQKKTAQVDKAAELEKLLKDADILRGGYKKDINGVIKHTTDVDKENVANILRAKSSIYAGKTLADFKGKMFISTYVATFIATYPERFADVQRTYQGKFNGLTAKIKKLDPSHSTDLFYY
jgi:plasmid replication initiation protein